ncbi:hypothetical protein SAMN04490188_4334 [Pseudomonas kilonensis]|uniref:Uncharacterized protein n=1 Tax=Pseudomonas kilonensis TaxID=132476 RepID=A0ABY0ZDC0_9PSED|nr:hypothetical protein SAMN04490188_4334 [Pseudomonas kilonensis]
MCRRLRGQARSHTRSGTIYRFAATANPCGSELARDGGGSACISVGCAAVFAGKPAPTLGRERSKDLRPLQIPVGASLLAMAVDQLASALDVPPSSRAGSLPHWVGNDLQICGHCKSLWEQSLLAIAVDQLASTLDVPPSSRAGSLPHWVGNDLQICGHCKSLWEQSLLAMAVDQLASVLDVPPSSRASPLPHWVGGDLQICGHCKFLWEQSLLAMAVDQLASALDVPPSSRASPLPQEKRGPTKNQVGY